MSQAEIRPNFSSSHTFSPTATTPECYLQGETKIEPDLRLRVSIPPILSMNKHSGISSLRSLFPPPQQNLKKISTPFALLCQLIVRRSQGKLTLILYLRFITILLFVWIHPRYLCLYVLADSFQNLHNFHTSLCYSLRGGGGSTYAIFGWRCAAGTLEPLAYNRASSAGFCYPSPNPPYPRVASRLTCVNFNLPI